MNDDQSRSLPPLTDLPVIRSTYCDQRMTDRVLAYLWKQEPELLSELAAEERQPFPECRSGIFRELCYAIGPAIREAKIDDVQIPQTRLALVDLLYELSRRLRKVQGLKEIPVFGKPLADSPQGPFPKFARVPVFPLGNPDKWISQEVADRVCPLIYQADPAAMYEHCEEEARLVVTHEIDAAFDNVVNEIRKEQQLGDHIGLRAEMGRRLHFMCARPSAADIMKFMEE